MTSVQGMNLDEVRHLANILTQRAQRLDAIRAEFDSLASGLRWVGADADQLRNMWVSMGRRALTDAAVSLRDAAKRLSLEAAQQESASDSDGQGASPLGAGMPAGVPAKRSGTGGGAGEWVAGLADFLSNIPAGMSHDLGPISDELIDLGLLGVGSVNDVKNALDGTFFRHLDDWIAESGAHGTSIWNATAELGKGKISWLSLGFGAGETLHDATAYGWGDERTVTAGAKTLGHAVAERAAGPLGGYAWDGGAFIGTHLEQYLNSNFHTRDKYFDFVFGDTSNLTQEGARQLVRDAENPISYVWLPLKRAWDFATSPGN